MLHMQLAEGRQRCRFIPKFKADKPDIDRFEQELLAEIQSAYGVQGAAGTATHFLLFMCRRSC